MSLSVPIFQIDNSRILTIADNPQIDSFIDNIISFACSLLDPVYNKIHSYRYES